VTFPLISDHPYVAGPDGACGYMGNGGGPCGAVRHQHAYDLTPVVHQRQTVNEPMEEVGHSHQTDPAGPMKGLPLTHVHDLRPRGHVHEQGGRDPSTFGSLSASESYPKRRSR
jgi:hypothetical protein